MTGVKHARSLATRLLLTCGNGDFGRLGLSSHRAQSVDIPKHVQSIDTVRVDQVACGGSHTLVLATDGTVLSFGLNDRGQCGHPPEDKPWLGEPLEVPIPEDVVCVSAGHYHSLAIGRESGALWVWGDNGSGQLGLGDDVDVSWYPRRIGLDTASLDTVSAGAYHSLVTTGDGEAYSFGEIGAKLGREGSSLLGKIQGLDGVRVDKVSAGHMHSACIDSDGRLYTFGNGRHAQLGHGSLKDCPVPTQVRDIQYAHDVACGGYHTLAILPGSCVAWGADQNGCLGTKSSGYGHRTRPDTIANLVDTRMVSAGWKHSAAIDYSGRMYSWGWGGSQGTAMSTEDAGGGGGQLGLGDDCDSWFPRRVDTIDVENALRIPQQQREDGMLLWKVLQISCGLNHTAMIVEMSS